MLYLGKLTNRSLVLVAAMLLLFWGSAGADAPLQFDQAKGRADEDEKALLPAELERLVEAQGKHVVPELMKCVVSKDTLGTPFVLVLQLDKGVVSRAWLQGAEPAKSCVDQNLIGKFVYRASTTPFFTSIEFSWTPPRPRRGAGQDT